MNPDSENIVFQLAADFVNNTGRHLFLTGKAGTGKTTFLKHIQATTRKNCVVVAPTGVAAINAGGVTMHSFFQLPLGPFIPVQHKSVEDQQATDKHSLFRNMRINRNKRKLMQELELLIIDEVSMVRGDMVDAIDTILRHFRRQPGLPFGGVQVLFIGDMYQLPPVTVEHEWQLLSQYYASPFFFDAQVIQQAPPLYIELKKIYRQSEQLFIDLLNRVRNNNAGNGDLEILNKKYRPNFSPAEGEKYITLCTHNYKADQINNSELQRLTTKPFTFKGELTGEFSDKALPAEMMLQLKSGAQVMFIKNDKGEARRFYNGKLGTVHEIKEDKITVQLDGSEELVVLEKETWRNIRYKLNDTQTEIEEEELGTFVQYPIRLAWAITIHKSQGLTFKKAIIDAGQSFTAGQVYVALSRCTSLDGIVLYSIIHPHSINTDYRIIEFAQRESKYDHLEVLLQAERKVFEASRLKRLFDWNRIVTTIENWQQDISDKKTTLAKEAFLVASELLEKACKQQETSLKFQRQLDGIIAAIELPENQQLLAERMNKAIGHFTKSLHDELAEPLAIHMKEVAKQKKVAQYMALLTDVHALIWNKLEDIWQAAYNDTRFCVGLPEYTRKAIVYQRPPKAQPGATRLETLKQFLEGVSIEEISLVRHLAKSTVEGHLAECIGKGELELEAVMAGEKIAAILPIIEKLGYTSLTPVKEALGDKYSFSELRLVAQHVKKTMENKIPVV
ncbi:MAG: helix-turn-helix domain-containing protein [Bacteroidota bacterium]